jgi:hypothetical protein
VLFVVFTVSTFLIALLTGLIVGLVGAVLFTLFMVMVALFVVLPLLFFTTFAATFIAVWGIGSYYIIQRLNKDKSPGEIATAIRERLGSVTNGSSNVSKSGTRVTEKSPSDKEAEITPTDDGKEF